MEEVNIKMREHLEDGEWIDTEDGEKIYPLVKRILDAGQVAVVSFAGGETVMTPFLNAAFGKLYATHSREFVRSHIRCVDVAPLVLQKFQKVENIAIRYYENNPDARDQLIRAEVGA